MPGWADAVWTQGKRFGTIGCLRGGRRTRSPPTGPRPTTPTRASPRWPSATRVEDDLSRRDFTVNAMALRLPDLELDRSVRRVWPTWPPDGCAPRSTPRSPSPTTRCGCCGPPGSSPGSTWSRRRSWSRRCRPATAGCPSCRPSGSGTSSTRWWWSRCPRWPCGSWSAPGWPTSSFPSCPAWPSSRTRSTATRTCWPTPWRWWTRRSPDRLLRLAALFHDVGKPRTRAFVDGGVTFHHHEVVGARMTRERMTALRYPKRRGRDGHRAGRAPPALPHLPAGVDRPGRPPLRPRRRAAARPAERADPVRLHHPQRGQGPGPGPAHGRARGAHRRAAGAGGARRHPPRPRRHPGHGAAGHHARAATSAAALSFLLELRLEEGPLGRGGGPPPAARVVGRQPEPERRGLGARAGQASGQTGPVSPAAKSSTMSWATSSWYCTGGDFMK